MTYMSLNLQYIPINPICPYKPYAYTFWTENPEPICFILSCVVVKPKSYDPLNPPVRSVDITTAA